MDNQQLVQIVRASSQRLGKPYDGLMLEPLRFSQQTYKAHQLGEFKRDLVEAGHQAGIIFLEQECAKEEFVRVVQDREVPSLVFRYEEGDYVPAILFKDKKEVKILDVTQDEESSFTFSDEELKSFYQEEPGKISFLGIFAHRSLVSDDEDPDSRKPLTPVQRLFRLLAEERRDIFYVYIYAVFIGLISLTLPLGIQATIALISGGVFFSSVYVLITLVIVGVLAVGGLQVMQITLVEYLQRRVFAKAALEFAFRVPRIKVEALERYHAPELINRFFDVLTLQKGLPKLLIDLSTAAIQILFGLLLLSFYHPFFVFFGLLLLGLLILIFYLTGPKGLNSSIKESKYKYKAVYWLEELARTLHSFKLSGNTRLPIRKTDYNVNNYLKNRKVHFGILISQYVFFILFKALVTGGLLIIGTILVVQREITLGQFVASEVVIILILNSVEKIIMYLDVVYDMLTAVDKIAHVTDLPLEKSGGVRLPALERGIEISVKNLYYRLPQKEAPLLQNVHLDIDPGEHICVSGVGGAGKTTLVNTIAGLNTDFEGMISIDGYPLRDLDLTWLRDKIGQNVSPEDIFEGTLLENVLLAKPQAQLEDALWAIRQVGIEEEVQRLPEGMHTPMISGGKGLPSSLVNKIILARCLAKLPRLLILNDFFHSFPKPERLQLLHNLTKSTHPWTLLVVSNDPLIMAACHRVVLLKDGKVQEMDSFDNLIRKESLLDIII